MNRMSYEKAIVILADVIVELGDKNLDGYVKEVLSAVAKKSPCWECFYNWECKTNGPELLKKCSDFYGVSEMLAHIFIIDALLLLRHTYTKFLSMAPNRRLNKIVKTHCDDLDGDGLDLIKQKAKAVGLKNLAVDTLFDRAKRIVIRTANDVDQKWDKKFGYMQQAFKKMGMHLKNIIEDKKTLDAVRQYRGDTVTALKLLSKYNRLPLMMDVRNVSRLALISIHKQDPDKVSNAVETLTDDEKNVMNNVLNPPKAERGEKTPETHPNFFTKDKTHKRLVKPIKLDSPDVIYNPHWNAKTDNTWYAQSKDPGTGDYGYHYTVDYTGRKKQDKFGDVAALSSALPSIRRNYNKDMRSNSKKTQLLALIVHLCDKGAFRIGNQGSEFEDVRGLHNLQVKHLELGPRNTLMFKYIGKDKIPQKANLKVDPLVYSIMTELMKGKKPDDYLITYEGKKVSPELVNEYFKEIGSPTTIHKFRHLNTTKLAKELLLDSPEIAEDSSNKEKIKYLKDVLKQIQDEIGHKSANTTKESYIDPTVIDQYIKRFHVQAGAIADIVEPPINYADEEKDLRPLVITKDISLDDEEIGDQEFDMWIDEMMPIVMEEKDPSIRIPTTVLKPHKPVTI